MARIELLDVCKSLDAFRIEDLNLSIPDGRTLVILGPSGCGKTTLLKIIAGLISPDSGRVRYNGLDVRDMTPGERKIGMVFQSYALYPHMDGRKNVLSWFLFRKKTPEMDALKKAKFQRTSELMGVELEHLLARKPPTLSGGEKQRVAVARCITRDPALFLLDEPFSNLDQALREKYRMSLKTLLRQFDITTVYVTHDHYEAMILADLVAIMDHGRIEQVGTYEEIYERPRTAFVAGFLNRHVGMPPISFLDARDCAQTRELGDVRVGVRPENVEVLRDDHEGGGDGERDVTTRGTVETAVSMPFENATMLQLRVGAHELHAQAPADGRWRAGDAVRVRFARYHVFDASGARVGTHP
jgi:ABC-type sugar transport system ATPase subunit